MYRNFVLIAIFLFNSCALVFHGRSNAPVAAPPVAVSTPSAETAPAAAPAPASVTTATASDDVVIPAPAPTAAEIAAASSDCAPLQVPPPANFTEHLKIGGKYAMHRERQVKRSEGEIVMNPFCKIPARTEEPCLNGKKPDETGVCRSEEGKYIEPGDYVVVRLIEGNSLVEYRLRKNCVFVVLSTPMGIKEVPLEEFYQYIDLDSIWFLCCGQKGWIELLWLQYLLPDDPKIRATFASRIKKLEGQMQAVESEVKRLDRVKANRSEIPKIAPPPFVVHAFAPEVLKPRKVRQSFTVTGPLTASGAERQASCTVYSSRHQANLEGATSFIQAHSQSTPVGFVSFGLSPKAAAEFGEVEYQHWATTYFNRVLCVAPGLGEAWSEIVSVTLPLGPLGVYYLAEHNRATTFVTGLLTGAVAKLRPHRHQSPPLQCPDGEEVVNGVCTRIFHPGKP